MTQSNVFHTSPAERAELTALLLSLAQMVDSGDVTGLAYIAQHCNGRFRVNFSGTLAHPAQMPRTRQMIDAMYQEAEQMPAASLSFVD